MKAIIAGGGIGGLCAALALQQRGWQVQICEQASMLNEVGAGIQLSPNACRVLRRLSVLEAVREKAFEPQALEMRWGLSGRRVFRIPLQEHTQQRWQAPYLHLHRADLVAALANELLQRSPDSLRLSCQVSGYENTTDGISVALSDGQRIEADLLIAADGVHSCLQQQMLGAQKAEFTGHIAWRVVVPLEALGDDAPPPTACVWVGPKRHAVTYRLRNGQLANFVGVVEQQSWESESWSATASMQQAMEDFAGWHPSLLKILEQADIYHRWALLARKPLQRWHQGRAVLLGDACHPMLPFMAQGAAMAIEDAWCLAQQLDDEANINQALSGYFNQRIARTARVQAASLANAKRFHHPSTAAYWPLWLAGKLFPSLALKQFDWIYQH